jgi:hypothetical protein
MRIMMGKKQKQFLGQGLVSQVAGLEIPFLPCAFQRQIAVFYQLRMMQYY